MFLNTEMGLKHETLAKNHTFHMPLHAQNVPATRDSYKPYVQNFEKTSMAMQGANVFVNNVVFQTRDSTY